MEVRLRMDIDNFRSQPGEQLHIISRVLDHQMHVRRPFSLPADILDILQAHAEVGDKLSIHHIQMV